MLLRHLLAVLLLPFVVVAAVPSWLLASWAGAGTGWTYIRPIGAGLFACGLILFVWCVGLFARVGGGTLAPWDPTRKLVAVGPYRYVRNPMITGVAAMLLGEALFFGSWVLALWASLFVLTTLWCPRNRVWLGALVRAIKPTRRTCRDGYRG